MQTAKKGFGYVLWLAIAVLALCPATQTCRGDEALAEVNANRAMKGLPAFAYDPGLTIAAQRAADLRAINQTFGHTSNDFAFLPPGTPVLDGGGTAVGCAAYPPSYGWRSCCTYENYRYAGAAYAVGRDGNRYMHLFVSNAPSTPQPASDPKNIPNPFAAAQPATCPDGTCGVSNGAEGYSFIGAACGSSMQMTQTIRTRVTFRERHRVFGGRFRGCR